MNSIRKEITIAARVPKVWEHLTNSGYIARWFLPNDFTPVVGHRFTLTCGHEEAIVCEVREVTPPTKLVYTFRPAGLPFETTVAFTLEETVSGTKLVLTHSGWGQVKPGDAALFDKFDQGWGSEFLPRLRKLFERDS